MKTIVKTVASGAIHIAEPDLDGLVQKVVSSGVSQSNDETRGCGRIYYRGANPDR